MNEEDKKSNLKDDELKVQVEKQAEASTHIDEKTAVVDEENKIIDIDTVLDNPQNADLANKINNLQELGISLDSIRKLLEARGEFSIGSTETELVEALDNLARQLIKDISEDLNGIVLNPDGSINEEMSQMQKDQIRNIANSIYKDDSQSETIAGTIEKHYKMEKEDIESKEYSVFDKIFEKETHKVPVGLWDSIDISEKNEEEDPEKEEEKENEARNETENETAEVLKELEKLEASSLLDNMKIEDKEKYMKPLLIGITSSNTEYASASAKFAKKLFSYLEKEGDPNSLLINLYSKVTGKEEKDLTKVIEGCRQLRNDVVSQKKEEKKYEEQVLAIEAQLEYADQNSPEYRLLLERRNEFYENHPEYKKYFSKMRDENGQLTFDAKKEMSNHINKLQASEIKNKIKRLKRKTNIKAISQDEKRQYAAYCLVGVVSNIDKDLSNDCLNELRKLYPELANVNYCILLPKITNDIMQNGSNDLNIDVCMENIKAMRQNLNRFLVGKEAELLYKTSKISDKEVTPLIKDQTKRGIINIEEVDITKTVMQNTFNNSKVDFTKEDEECFSKLYAQSSINSWMSSKDEVIRHRCMSMLILKDIYLHDEIEHKSSKLKHVDDSLKRASKEHPEILNEFLEKSPEEKKAFKEEEEIFQESKINSKVLDFYQKYVISTQVNYSELNKRNNIGSNKELDKMDYFKMVILTRELAENAKTEEEKQMFLKLSNRGLELMNSKDKKFITFDENGEAILNEKNLVEEYNTFRTVGQITVEDAKVGFEKMKKDIYDKYKRFYVFGKLREYVGLKEEEFVPLTTTTPEEQIKEINQIRFRMNQKRSKEKIYEAENKENNTESILSQQKQEKEEKEEHKVGAQKEENDKNNNVENVEQSKKNKFLEAIKNQFKKFKNLFAPKLGPGKGNEDNSVQSEFNANDQKPKTMDDELRVEGVIGKVNENQHDAQNKKSKQEELSEGEKTEIGER